MSSTQTTEKGLLSKKCYEIKATTKRQKPGTTETCPPPLCLDMACINSTSREQRVLMVEERFVMGRLKTSKGSEKQTSISQVWNYSNRLPKAEEGLNCIIPSGPQLPAAELAVDLPLHLLVKAAVHPVLCSSLSAALWRRNQLDCRGQSTPTRYCVLSPPVVRSVWQSVPKEKSVTPRWGRDERCREWTECAVNLVPDTRVCNIPV